MASQSTKARWWPRRVRSAPAVISHRAHLPACSNPRSDACECVRRQRVSGSSNRPIPQRSRVSQPRGHRVQPSSLVLRVAGFKSRARAHVCLFDSRPCGCLVVEVSRRRERSCARCALESACARASHDATNVLTRSRMPRYDEAQVTSARSVVDGGGDGSVGETAAWGHGRAAARQEPHRSAAGAKWRGGTAVRRQPTRTVICYMRARHGARNRDPSLRPTPARPVSERVVNLKKNVCSELSISWNIRYIFLIPKKRAVAHDRSIRSHARLTSHAPTPPARGAATPGSLDLKRKE